MSLVIYYPVPEVFPDPRARFIQIIYTCHALAKAGARVRLLTGVDKNYSGKQVLEYYGLEEVDNLSLVRMPVLRGDRERKFRFSWHGLFHFFLLLYLFFNSVSRRKSSIIYVRHLKLAAIILWCKKLLGLPVIFEVHEIFHLTTDNLEQKQTIRRREYRVYSKADALVCISGELKKALVDMGVGFSSISVIRRGLPEDWLTDQPAASRDILLYTGGLYAWKGVDILIAAMEHLPGEKLVIAGGGNRLNELKNLAGEKGVAGRVLFAGQVPYSSIKSYIARAKTAFLPNIPEGASLYSSPNKLFEYMAYGAPIVASDIPVFREILTDGRNALLFKPGDPEHLAACVKRIVNEPGLAERLSSEARRDAGRYTHEQAAVEIINLMKRASAGGA